MKPIRLSKKTDSWLITAEKQKFRWGDRVVLKDNARDEKFETVILDKSEAVKLMKLLNRWYG